MFRFLIDTQLPPKLSKHLVKIEGCNAIHTTFFGNRHLLTDSKIREIAIKEDRIIITKDIDFLVYARLKGIPPRILYLGFGNISNELLISNFNKNFAQICSLFQENLGVVILSYDGLSAF